MTCCLVLAGDWDWKRLYWPADQPDTIPIDTTNGQLEDWRMGTVLSGNNRHIYKLLLTMRIAPKKIQLYVYIMQFSNKYVCDRYVLNWKLAAEINVLPSGPTLCIMFYVFCFAYAVFVFYWYMNECANSV